jgi:adenine deaminase
MGIKMSRFFDDLDDELQEKLNEIPLTSELIRTLPKVDIHVHLPGTISPRTAWKLGIRNRFITIEDGKWYNGPESLSINDPFEHYSDVFKIPEDVVFDDENIPLDLKYNIAPQNFKSFDMVMATVQGHRHPPGGIQNEDDLQLVLRAYLDDCITQNISYTELQQNIRIAYHIYPESTPEIARRKLYYFLEQEVKAFAASGVHMRFLHCFNKTQAADLPQSADIRALEAASWLQESKELVPGVFVGLESAGHEKDKSGWPVHLKAGYEAAKTMGFGCEAHGGEGVGVEHLMDVIRTLPVTRIAHGFQVIEDIEVIEEIKERGVIFVMSPIINLSLGACIHYCAKNGSPKPNTYGGEKQYVKDLDHHPLFTLLRGYKMKLTLCSDNPEIAGVPIQSLFMMLAGIEGEDYHVPSEWLKCTHPLKTGELVSCLVNGINAAFCEDSVKQNYLSKLEEVVKGVI